MKKMRSLAIHTALVVGALAIALGAALLVDAWLNLGLRFAVGTLFSTNLQRPEPIMYAYDNRAGWILNPRTQYHRAKSGPLFKLAGLQAYDTQLRVNSEGFIDREHYLESSRYRIAFAGNSWVEAVQVEFTNRFAPLTEDYVFAQSKNERVIEIMNFGMSNAAPSQAYGIIKHFALKYRPDEVWLFVTGADLSSNTPVDTPPPFGPTFVYANAARTELADIRFGYVDPPAYTTWKRQQELKELTSTYTSFGQVIPFLYSEERNPVFERAWTDMRLSIGLIKKTLDREGVRMRLVFIPPRLEMDPGLWAQWVRQANKAVGRELKLDPALSEKRFTALAKDLGIELVSLAPLCREKGPGEMYADHFSRMGHHWVADHLAGLILKTTPENPRSGASNRLK